MRERGGVREKRKVGNERVMVLTGAKWSVGGGAEGEIITSPILAPRPMYGANSIRR